MNLRNPSYRNRVDPSGGGIAYTTDVGDGATVVTHGPFRTDAYSVIHGLCIVATTNATLRLTQGYYDADGLPSYIGTPFDVALTAGAGVEWQSPVLGECAKVELINAGGGLCEDVESVVWVRSVS